MNINLPQVLLIAIIALALWIIFHAQRASIEFSKAKRHTAWSNMGMYIVIGLCILAVLTVQFRLNVFKISLKDNALTWSMGSSDNQNEKSGDFKDQNRKNDDPKVQKNKGNEKIPLSSKGNEFMDWLEKFIKDQTKIPKVDSGE